MIAAAVRPRGPFSLRISSRLAGDATRSFASGPLVAALAAGGTGRAWQQPDGVVQLRAPDEAGIERAALRARAGRRPLRVPRAVPRRPAAAARPASPPRLPPAPAADGHARVAARGVRPADPGEPCARDRAERHPRRDLAVAGTRFHEPPTPASFAAFSPAQLRRLGLGARRGATLIRLCRSLDLEGLRSKPDRLGGRPPGARARPRALVGWRRLAGGPRALRARARRRPRPRQARVRSSRSLGRGLGDRRAAGAVRRMGGSRERVPAAGIPARPRAFAGAQGRLNSKRMATDPRKVAILGLGTIGESLLSGLLSGGWREASESPSPCGARSARRSSRSATACPRGLERRGHRRRRPWS